jgi:hypothetical protein
MKSEIISLQSYKQHDVLFVEVTNNYNYLYIKAMCLSAITLHKKEREE